MRKGLRLVRLPFKPTQSPIPPRTEYIGRVKIIAPFSKKESLVTREILDINGKKRKQKCSTNRWPNRWGLRTKLSLTINSFLLLTLGFEGFQLINQVGFSGSFEESECDDSYRNDPTVEGVSKVRIKNCSKRLPNAARGDYWVGGRLGLGFNFGASTLNPVHRNMRKVSSIKHTEVRRRFL